MPRTPPSTRSRRPATRSSGSRLDDLYDIGGGALPLGVRDSGRRLRDRDQPVRPAGRRGVQDRDARADGRVRAARQAARRNADPQRSTASPSTRTSATPRRCRPRRARTRSSGMLKAHLGRIGRGDYAALLAYLEMTPGARAGAGRDPPDDQGSHASRHLRRLRAAVPALHRAGVQGRAQLGRLPPDHLRRRPRPACPGAEVHLRRRQGRPGARRLPGPGRARPAGASNPHRRGRRRRPCRDPRSRRAGAVLE